MPPTALIIDDDEDCRHIFSLALEHDGFQVSSANNGLEGIRLAGEHPPDLILLDIMMPVMDGTTALRILRGNKLTRNVPVLGITAKASIGRTEREEFDEILLKPIEPRTLVAAARRAIEGG